MNVIQRVFGANEWRTMTSAEIATALGQPAALRKMDLASFLEALVGAGAAVDDLKPLWDRSEFIQRFSAAIWAGDLRAVMLLLAMIPVELSPETATAIETVIAANTLRAVDVHWPGDAVSLPPMEVTAELVADWLADAGYSWDGSQWSPSGG